MGGSNDMTKTICHAILIVPTLTLAFALYGGCCGGADSGDWDLSEVDSGTTAGGGGKTAAVCNHVGATSKCDEYKKSHMDFADLHEGLCELVEGTWTKDGSCPAENRVATCTDSSGLVTIYYSDGGLPYTAETAKSDCELLTGNTFAAL